MHTPAIKIKSIPLLVMAFLLLAVSVVKTQSPAPVKTREGRGTAFTPPGLQVNAGFHVRARDYYKVQVKKALAINKPGIFEDVDSGADPPNFIIENSRMDSLLEWMGYKNEFLVTVVDLHSLSSKDLMAKSPETIFAARFFAPKVSDVSTPPRQVPVGGFGWRKLVVMKPREGSDAATRGFTAMYLLQNTFTANATDDPYDAKKLASLNNQIILTRGKDNPDTLAIETNYGDPNRAAYFLMYGELIKVKVKANAQGQPVKTNVPDLDASGNFQSEGQLITNLKATFDNNTREFDPETGIEPNNYFTPDACIDCHGRSKVAAKVNFLDTDHWFDRVAPNYGHKQGWADFYKEEDFTALAQSPHRVLYDQKDVSAKESYRIIREINTMVEKQNELADPNAFQRKAVAKWLELHAVGKSTEVAHVPPVDRAFGTVLWDKTKDEHLKTLYFLNRYCYRCHSSVVYNIYDMDSVVSRIRKDNDDTDKGIINRLKMFDSQPTLPEQSLRDRWMPQDRVIEGFVLKPAPPGPVPAPPTLVPEGQLKEFLELLETLSPAP